jgi:hypothetical protein
MNRGLDFFNIGNDVNRIAQINFTLGPEAQANRHPDRLDLNRLHLVAEENARVGNVGVEVEVWRVRPGITNPEMPTQSRPAVHTGHWERVDRGSVVVARYAPFGFTFELHEDADLDDHWLMSGQVDWSFSTPDSLVAPAAVIAPWPDEEFHRTAAVVLTETVPGSMALTGRSEIRFEFGEGIQVLGARLEALDRGLEAYDNHEYEEVEVWWIDGRPANRGVSYLNGPEISFWNTLVGTDFVSLMPTQYEGARPRNRLASIKAEFYVSVQAGYEHLFGNDIDVTVRGAALDSFTASLTVAQAWDPITVETNPVVLDEADGQIAFGRVRAPIGDIVIHEAAAGSLRSGTELWIGIEGSGFARGLPTAIGVSAASAVADRDSGLRVSATPIRDRDGLGFMVRIITPSVEDGGTITFSGVEIDGAVLPEIEYNIIVGGDSVADNWLDWERRPQVFTGRRAMQGFFDPEPYPTYAFSFTGEDFYAPEGGGEDGGWRPPTDVTPPTFATPRITGPTLLTEASNWPLADGGQVDIAYLMHNQTSFVAARALADMAGFPWGRGHSDWTYPTATFADGHGNTIIITLDSPIALVNGVPRQLVDTAGRAAPPVIRNGRMYVPIGFFNAVEFFPLTVTWSPQNGAPAVTVTPRW